MTDFFNYNMPYAISDTASFANPYAYTPVQIPLAPQTSIPLLFDFGKNPYSFTNTTPITPPYSPSFSFGGFFSGVSNFFTNLVSPIYSNYIIPQYNLCKQTLSRYKAKASSLVKYTQKLLTPSKAVRSTSHPHLYTTNLNGYNIHTIGGGIDVTNLKSEIKNKLIALAKEAERHGYTLYVSSGFRSHQSQIDLKRRKPKLAASPYKSPHEYGCAFDIGLLDEKGRKVDIKNVGWFHTYATNNLDLVWGQNWTRWPKESWHFNLKNWQYRSDVRGEYLAYNGKLPNGSRA